MLIQTWNDDSASFGDKVAQTFMTLGMLIPGVISAYQTLQSVTAAHNLAKAQEIALTETVNVLRLKDLSGLTQEQILEEANNEIVEYFKKETTNVLGKVLYTASLKMKNAYSRSDA